MAHKGPFPLPSLARLSSLSPKSQTRQVRGRKSNSTGRQRTNLHSDSEVRMGHWGGAGNHHPKCRGIVPIAHLPLHSPRLVRRDTYCVCPLYLTTKCRVCKLLGVRSGICKTGGCGRCGCVRRMRLHARSCAQGRRLSLACLSEKATHRLGTGTQGQIRLPLPF